MPVAYALILIGFIGFCYVTSVSSALSLMVKTIWAIFSSYEFSVIPMFILMGTLAFHSGFASRIYFTAHKFFGYYRGGLLIATTLGCAAFGSVCGSTTAAVATIGKTAYPEIEKYGYDRSLSTACIAASGSLAILIPPSNMLIIYGVLTEQPIGKLFTAGILPGLLLTLLFIIAIIITRWLKPELVPVVVNSKISWKEKFASLSNIVDVFLLFLLMMGGLFIGWFSPTEAGAVGVIGMVLIGFFRKTLNWENFFSAIYDTARITGMIFLIVSGATIFGYFAAVTQFPSFLSALVSNLHAPPSLIIAIIIIGYLIGGCFMDSLAMVTLTVPILFPLILKLGFDPIWFGVIIVLVVEMGVITPPVGINVYVLSGSLENIPTETIFRGIIPYLIAIIICTFLILFFPKIVLLLPMYITY